MSVSSKDLILIPDEKKVLELCKDPSYKRKCSPEFWKEYLQFNYPGIVLPTQDSYQSLVGDVSKLKEDVSSNKLLHKDFKVLKEVKKKIMALYESYRYQLLLKIYQVSEETEKTRIEQEEGFTAKISSIHLYYHYQEKIPIVLGILNVTQDDYFSSFEGSKIATEFSLPDYNKYKFKHSLVEMISLSEDEYLQEIADNDNVLLIPIREKMGDSYEGNPFSAVYQEQ